MSPIEMAIMDYARARGTWFTAEDCRLSVAPEKRYGFCRSPLKSLTKFGFLDSKIAPNHFPHHNHACAWYRDAEAEDDEI